MFCLVVACYVQFKKIKSEIIFYYFKNKINIQIYKNLKFKYIININSNKTNDNKKLVNIYNIISFYRT